MRPAQRGEALAGDDPDLGGQRLEQHGDQVRQRDDPKQAVAIARASLDVGREIAGVDIGDRGNHRGPDERQEPAQAAALTVQTLLACSHGTAGQTAGEGDFRAAGLMDDGVAHAEDLSIRVVVSCVAAAPATFCTFGHRM